MHRACDGLRMPVRFCHRAMQFALLWLCFDEFLLLFSCRRAPGQGMNRREMLFAMAASGAGMLAPQLYARPASDGFLNSSDERFLDELERRACLYFWEQASPISGQILDRARNDSTGSRDDRRMASIAATGFGLTGLCIADARGYLPHSQVVERVRTALDFHLNRM